MTTAINMPSYIFAETVGVFTVLIVAASTVLPGINIKHKRYFIGFFLFTALNGAVFAIDMMTYMNPETLALSRWFPLIEYLLYPLPHIIVTLFLIEYCGDGFKNNLSFRVIVSLWFLYCLILVPGHLTNFFYYTDPDGCFFRKPPHPLVFVPIIVIFMIDLTTLIRKRKMISKRHFYAFVIYLIAAIISTVIHSYIFAIMIINIAIWICAVAMYVLIITDQIEQHIKQQTAIANQNASILILQMRPHFIYNTMTSIYYLCEQNPTKAQQTILDFTTYLRKNFNAIGSSDPIPFSEELEHVRAYLAVEHAQFEENLLVEYDTPYTDFRIPPLTLEPLVENAVKYGLDPDADPLHIQIQTSQTKSGFLIIIKDNGPGFDPKNVFNTHNALSNIKKRLEIMCHGNITVTSQKGEGTAVMILVPGRS